MKPNLQIIVVADEIKFIPKPIHKALSKIVVIYRKRVKTKS